MPVNDLFLRLVDIYKDEPIRHPELRSVTLAQWILESGRGESDLAKLHYNFGGLKWRKEMAPFATKVSYKAHDGKDDYCKFATLENFISGYWAFLNRSPYTGWEEHADSGEDFIRFIGPIYTPSAGYADKVLALVAEADALLTSAPRAAEATPVAATPGTAVNLGTIVIDPGHGGTKNVPGSSANNAISASGVKEKKLTLDFGLILRDELLRQAKQNGETIKVVLTRTTDENVTGAKRAGKAFDEKAKIFLSLHFNGSKDPKVTGGETFYRAKENNNLNLAEDIAFAKIVQKGLADGMKLVNTKFVDRGVKPDTQTQLGALGVLNDDRLGNDERKDMCVAALMEIEFITNVAVDKLIVSGPDAIANRTKVLASVATSIREYLRS